MLLRSIGQASANNTQTVISKFFKLLLLFYYHEYWCSIYIQLLLHGVPLIELDEVKVFLLGRRQDFLSVYLTNHE